MQAKDRLRASEEPERKWKSVREYGGRPVLKRVLRCTFCFRLILRTYFLRHPFPSSMNLPVSQGFDRIILLETFTPERSTCAKIWLYSHGGPHPSLAFRTHRPLNNSHKSLVRSLNKLSQSTTSPIVPFSLLLGSNQFILPPQSEPACLLASLGASFQDDTAGCYPP